MAGNVTECGEIMSDEDFEIDEFAGEVNKVVLLQALFRGAFVRKWLKDARDQYESIVREIEYHPAVIVAWKSASLCVPSVEKRRARKSNKPAELQTATNTDRCVTHLTEQFLPVNDLPNSLTFPIHIHGSEASSHSISPRGGNQETFEAVVDGEPQADNRKSETSELQSDRSDRRKNSRHLDLNADDLPASERGVDIHERDPVCKHACQEDDIATETTLSQRVSSLHVTEPTRMASIDTQAIDVTDNDSLVVIKSDSKTNLEERRKSEVTSMCENGVGDDTFDSEDQYSGVQRPKGANHLEQQAPSISTVFGDVTSIWESDKLSFSVTGTSQATSKSVTVEDLPRDPDLLKERRHHVAMELLWVQQAIHSRKQYLRLKNQMKSAGQTT